MRLASSLLIRGREVSSCFHQGYEPAARLNNCTWDSRSIEPRVRCGSRLPRSRVMPATIEVQLDPNGESLRRRDRVASTETRSGPHSMTARPLNAWCTPRNGKTFRARDRNLAKAFG